MPGPSAANYAIKIGTLVYITRLWMLIVLIEGANNTNFLFYVPVSHRPIPLNLQGALCYCLPSICICRFLLLKHDISGTNCR